jgi:multidrug resistance efflux pump
MRRIVILVVVIIIVLGGAAFGVNLWLQGSRYVTTDNARISAPLISVNALAAGQIISVNVDVGDRVNQLQSVAQVGTPRFSDSAGRQGYSAIPSSETPIQAPVAGYVAAVWTYAGAVIGPGTPIVTLFDDSNVWVTANIEETKINNVRPGQEVEVIVDSLGGTMLKGKVEGISPSTSSNFSLLPQSNTTGNYIKVAQVIPVKITLDNLEGLALIPGGSVEVKILVK